MHDDKTHIFFVSDDTSLNALNLEQKRTVALKNNSSNLAIDQVLFASKKIFARNVANVFSVFYFDVKVRIALLER